MNSIFIFSVIIKGLGAILEILAQLLITNKFGLEAYGTYVFGINAADLIFLLLFSGLVRCNVFYLSQENTTIRPFKINFYKRYVLPVIGVLVIASFFAQKEGGILIQSIASSSSSPSVSSSALSPLLSLRSILSSIPLISVIPLITLAELLVMDLSSTLLARKQTLASLLGEYVLGRLVLVISILFFQKSILGDPSNLLLLYLLQYGVILIFFLSYWGRDRSIATVSPVSLRKWLNFQRADLVQTTLTQIPVLLQFFFSGAVAAGAMSIILLTKKLVGFISGPASKLYLPEFSRLYKENNLHRVSSLYSSIMRIQLLFLVPLSIFLLGFPQVILKVFNRELLPYARLFQWSSLVFLVSALLGPAFGVLQMTGHEKEDNLFREVGLVLAVIVFLLFRKDPFFVLYGLLVQTFFESAGKFVYVCLLLKKIPMPFCGNRKRQNEHDNRKIHRTLHLKP